MKTTNYEISKQLKEAKFAYEYDCGYTPRGKLIDIQEQMGAYHIQVPSFCLETIVDALPLKIGGYGYFSIGVRKDNPSMPFAVGYNLECDEDYGILFCDKIKNESLADTAARLWLKLKEKGI